MRPLTGQANKMTKIAIKTNHATEIIEHSVPLAQKVVVMIVENENMTSSLHYLFLSYEQLSLLLTIQRSGTSDLRVKQGGPTRIVSYQCSKFAPLTVRKLVRNQTKLQENISVAKWFPQAVSSILIII